MTIRAYPETYLSKAQAVLGDAFDYAINTCGISGEDFVRLFRDLFYRPSRVSGALLERAPRKREGFVPFVPVEPARK